MISSDEPLTANEVDALSPEALLKQLGLHVAANAYEPAARKAIGRNEGPQSLLHQLMADELRARIEKRAEGALKTAKIFPVTTLDSYDWDYPEAIDRDLVLRAATLDFVRSKTSVVLVGPSGVGKTHIGNALGVLATLRGYRVRFVVAADLVNDLVARQARNTLDRGLAQWASYDCLILDELGYLSFDERGADLLYQVLNRRYRRASTVVTTNLAFKDWGALFHNVAAATAIAERLVDKGLLIRIAGKSHRAPLGAG